MSDSDDIEYGGSKTDQLDVPAQLKIMRHDLKARFDRIEEKLDDHREHTDVKIRALEMRSEEQSKEIVEIKARAREKDAGLKVVVAIASIAGAALAALIGKLM